MIDVFLIKNRFSTMQAYEVFHNEWAKACYLLNPTEQNKERLEHSEKELAMMQEQNKNEESEQDD